MQNVVTLIKRHFIGGMLVIVPLILTYLVLKFLFESIDGVLQPIIHSLLGYFVPGLGVITTLLLILLAGILTRNYIGEQLYSITEKAIARLPLIRPVYSAVKQLVEAIAGPTMQSFKEVALVEYPKEGVWAIGFVSNRVEVEIDGRMTACYSVFMPSTPTPVSGMVIIIPKEKAHLLSMSIEEGIKFLVSGGVASPLLLSDVKQNDMNESRHERSGRETC